MPLDEIAITLLKVKFLFKRFATRDSFHRSTISFSLRRQKVCLGHKICSLTKCGARGIM